MANNLGSNTSEIVLKKFTEMFHSDVVSCKTVDRQTVGNGDLNPSTGDRIAVKRPTQFKSERTSDGDVSGSTPSDIIVGNAYAVAQDYITVRVDYKQVEQALELNQLEALLSPIKTRMVTDLETSLNQFMLLNSSHQLGSAGSAISKWSDVAQVAAFMDSFGFEAGDRFAQINPYAQINLADAQSGLFSTGKVDSAWEKAMITRQFGGMQAYTSNALSNHTNGNQVSNAGITLAATPVQTYVSTKDTFTTQLALTGLTATTGTLNAGDVIKVVAASGAKWVNQQTKQVFFNETGVGVDWTATVVEDVTADGSGEATVTVTGPAIYDATGAFNSISAALASGDAVAVVSGATDSQLVQPNIAYHKRAFGLCTVELPKLHAKESSVINYDGISIRVHKYSDGDANVQKMRFDILPAFAAYNPYQAIKFYGNP